MRLMQDGQQSIEHHVIRWCNHNHGTLDKRKMLGGVSFDGGGASVNNRSQTARTQAGVQDAQPSFPNMDSDNVSLSGIGLSLGRGVGRAGIGNEKADRAGKANEADKADKTDKTNKVDKSQDVNAVVGVKADDISTKEIEKQNMPIAASGTLLENTKADAADKDNTKGKRLKHIKETAYKFGKGIIALFSKSEQDVGKRSGQKPKKKLSSGTRSVTKEDIYEVQVNSSYLLESYNKNGERSTLGK